MARAGNPNAFLNVFAAVGWALALALALYPRPVPIAPPLAQSSPGPSALAATHDSEVRSYLQRARNALLRRQPQDALDELAQLFASCRQRDQQPPVECYEVLTEALRQVASEQRLVSKERAPLARAGTESEQPAGRASRSTEAAGASVSRAQRKVSRASFSLPKPDYPTASTNIRAADKPVAAEPPVASGSESPDPSWPAARPPIPEGLPSPRELRRRGAPSSFPEGKRPRRREARGPGYPGPVQGPPPYPPPARSEEGIPGY
jgi:hypothetical protein